MQPLLRNLLTLGLATCAASLPNAQTWRAEVAGSGNIEGDIVLSDDGVTLINYGYDSTSFDHQPSQITFDAQGAVKNDFAHYSFSNQTLIWYAGLRSGTGALAVAGGENYSPWMGVLDPQTGAVLWDHGITQTPGTLFDMCRNSLGFYLGVGTVKLPSGMRQSYICAVDENGGVRFRRTYGDGTYDRGESICELSDGRVAMASVQGISSAFFMDTIRITWMNEWGQIQEQTKFSSPFGLDHPELVPTSDGGLLLTGVAQIQQFEFEVFACRLDAQGSVLWSKRYQTFPGDYFQNSYHEVVGAVQTPDQGFALAVTQPMPGTTRHDDPGILRLDANGNALWLRTFGNPLVDEDAHDIAVTADGGFVLAAGKPESAQLSLVRTDKDGQTPGCPSTSLGVFEANLPLTLQAESFPYTNDPGGLRTAHTSTGPFTRSAQKTCGTTCEALGGSFGVGLAGTGGVTPQLQASSAACLGWTPELRITQGRGGAPAIFAYSLTNTALPIFGGTLYVDPSQWFTKVILLDGTPGAPGAGTATIPVRADLRSLIGTTITSQAAVLDGAAPAGVSLTAAATLTIQ